jgi:hypothetical protein
VSAAAAAATSPCLRLRPPPGTYADVTAASLPPQSTQVPPPPIVRALSIPSRIRTMLSPPPRLRLPSPPPPTSNSRRRQPVPPASPAPRYIRCRHRRFCFPLFPADHASANATAARGPCPGYSTLGTTYVATAGAPVAVSIPRPNRHQRLLPDTEPSLPPPKETSRHFILFFDSSSLPPETEAYQNSTSFNLVFNSSFQFQIFSDLQF